MRNLALGILLILTIILVSRCNVFLETDLTNVSVVMKAPTNNLTTIQESQTFWWDYVTGATFYNIQIVSPSFDSIQQLITDSEVTENTFDISLSPGTYQWTVIAYNNNYQSQSEIYNLTIEESEDLDGQSVLLVSPSDNGLTNDNPVRLLWQSLSAATAYHIQVASPDFTNSTFIITDDTTTNDYLEVLNLADGTYQWRVKAINNNTETAYTLSSFTVDRTPPTAPTLVSPNDGSVFFLNNSIQLNWSSASDAVQDTLFVNKDLGLSEETVVTLPTTDFTYTFVDSTSTTSQSYFWKVKSVDEVGNVSTSSQWSFEVQ